MYREVTHNDHFKLTVGKENSKIHKKKNYNLIIYRVSTSYRKKQFDQKVQDNMNLCITPCNVIITIQDSNSRGILEVRDPKSQGNAIAHPHKGIIIIQTSNLNPRNSKHNILL